MKAYKYSIALLLRIKVVKMIIRKAKNGDLKYIAEIFRVESSRPPYNKKRTPEKALEIIQEDFKAQDLYVTTINNLIIGFVMVQRDSGIKEKLWINELWILKQYQGQGIGTRIMNEIETIYKNKGIKSFELVADTNEGGAQGFYKKIGYNVDNNLIFMQKRLK